MAIPQVQGVEALLPPGRHRATLAEIEAYFVTTAPYDQRRVIVFQALRTWLALVDQLLPNSRYWINGGFVTHKPWAAPSDVDVMILCKENVLNALSIEEQAQLDRLLTVPASPGRPRIQPMSGLVDGFLTVRGYVGSGDAAFWMKQWSRVKGADGSAITSLSKGFLEVVL